MYPKPRDFTLGLFKYKTTDADSEFPTDADLRNTIRDGLTGTAMPGWKELLSDKEIDALIAKIKVFGYWDEEDPADLKPIEMGEMPAVTPEILAVGRENYQTICAECHGLAGRGNITSGKRLTDDGENRVWPRNLTHPESWRMTVGAKGVFQRLSVGIPSSPMPEHTTALDVETRWAIANYVMGLQQNATPASKGDSVIKAMRLAGDLPTEPNDPVWDSVAAMTFNMAPNIIKEPRLFTTLTEFVTVRAVYNDTDLAMRVDIDDRTYSVPGSDLEREYALDDVVATRDAIAVQIPAALTGSTEKPYFRQGDKKNPVNMWLWSAPSVEPKADQSGIIMDAKGLLWTPRVWISHQNHAMTVRPLPPMARGKIAAGRWCSIGRCKQMPRQICSFLKASTPPLPLPAGMGCTAKKVSATALPHGTGFYSSQLKTRVKPLGFPSPLPGWPGCCLCCLHGVRVDVLGSKIRHNSKVYVANIPKPQNLDGRQ